MATLLLRLAAPLQSWGADSKFETRKTNREPTKSGVIGLLAAALGLRRDDAAGLARLNGLHFAVRADREGSLLVDFHTANREEDRKKGKAPYVTYRHYLQDAVFLVGLESEDTALLQELETALKHPVYPLYLGRRSCPPTLPLFLGIRAGKLLDTLRAEPLLVKQRNRAPLRIVADADPADAAAVPRRDLAVSFSPIHRQYGFRPVREWNTNPPEMPGATEHDAMAELRREIMYLSRAELDPTRRETMVALISPQKFHGAVENAFPGARRRRLWRLDQLGEKLYLLLLSEERPDLTALCAQFGTGAPPETRPYDPLLERVTAGSCWQFRLTANPTRSKKDSADHTARGTLKPCYFEVEQEEWLWAQAAKHGFAVSEGSFAVTRKQTYHFKKNGTRPVTLLAVTYEGILQVTDPEAFKALLCEGVGRGKAYGLGLMTIIHRGGDHG